MSCEPGSKELLEQPLVHTCAAATHQTIPYRSKYPVVCATCVMLTVRHVGACAALMLLLRLL